MRAIILEKNFMPDPTGMIASIILYASGGKGKELANPKTDVKPTIDVRYCSRVDLDKPLMYDISSLDIDFTKRVFYLSDERIERLEGSFTLNMISKINHAKNFKEVWDLITINTGKGDE